MTPTTACVLTAAGAATAALVESGRLRQRMSAMSPERLRPRWRAPTIPAGPGVVAVAVIGGLAGAAWLGPVGFVVGAVGGGVGVVWATRLTTSRRQRIVRRQLPEALDLMAGAMRCGHSIRQALASGAVVGGPLGDALAVASTHVEMGESLADALDQLARVEPMLASACAALAIGLTAGGDAGRALRRLAEVSRQRERVRRELAALTAQARLSAAVLGSLPVGALGFFAALGPPTHRAFLREPLGQACLLVGLAFDGAGFVVLRRLGRTVGA